MFLLKYDSKSTLLCAKADYGKVFMFEATLHWAEKGDKVYYISSEPLKSIPANYHDRNVSSSIFNMIKFIYLSDYEALVEQLANLHTFTSLPSVLIIDNLDNYITDDKIKEHKDMHIARLCALIQDSLNSCMRVKKNPIHFCTATDLNFTPNTPLEISYFLYFNQVWILNDRKENNEVIMDLNNVLKASRNLDDSGKKKEVFSYRFFEDKTLILDKIFEKQNEFNV